MNLGHGGLGAVTSLDAMLSGAQQHLKQLSPEARSTLAKLVVVVLEPSDARLVELAAARHGLRFER